MSDLPPDVERLIEQGVADQSIFTPANREAAAMGKYRVTITEWDRPDVDEIEVECEAPLPWDIKAGDEIVFKVRKIKRVTFERSNDD